MELERRITVNELRHFDGESAPMYIAFRGIVYDVGDCQKWRSGLHEGLHFPGQDLTIEIDEAPHQEEVFALPCVKRVGILISLTTNQT